MKRFFPQAVSGALLVFLGLFSALFSLVDPFALEVDQPLLFLLCLLTALGVGVLCALPRRRASFWTTLGLCALLALLLWRNWAQLSLGAQVVFHHISYGYSQEIVNVLYYILPSSLTAAAAAQAATAFLAFCIPLLGLWLGTWLLGGWAVWPGVAVVCLLPGLGLFILREPHPLCLAALLLFLGLVVLSRRGYRASPALGSRRVLIALVPLGLTMALLGLLLPQGSYRRAGWVEDLRLNLQRPDLAAITLPRLTVSGRTASGRQPFSQVGPLRFDGHTVLTVQATGGQSRLLLRGFSAGAYTPSGWQPLDSAGYDALQLGNDRQPWSFPAAANYARPDQSAQEETVTVTQVASPSRYCYLPYFPTQMPQGVRWTQDAYALPPDGSSTYQSVYVPPEDISPTAGTAALKGSDYLSGVMPSYLPPADDPAEVAYRAYVYENYLDLPAQLLSEDAIALMERCAAAQEPAVSWPDGSLSLLTLRDLRTAQAQRVADFLASFTAYDQSVSVTPSGEDFVSWFLTESRRGYCVHYASAAVLMLRYMGIPARYVSGYVADLAASDQLVNIPDRNAHAWVEFYVDGFGWVPFDVTPGFSGDQPDDPLVASATPSPSPTPSADPTPTPTPPSHDPPETLPTPPANPASPLLPPWVIPLVLWTLALAALVLFTLLQRRLRLDRRRRKWGQEDPNQSVLAIYHYLEALERHAGLPVPIQARDLAQKAAFSQHTLTPQEVETAQALAAQGLQAAQALPLPRRLLLRYLWALV